MDIATYLSTQSVRLTAFSRGLGITPSAVRQWITGARPVPVSQGVAIENLTRGMVTRRDLYTPDVLAAHWPDLINVPVGDAGAATKRGAARRRGKKAAAAAGTEPETAGAA